MACRVVCISQTTGSGGEAVARLVAERLGYRRVDEEIVQRAAVHHGLEPDLVADVEKRKSFIARYLEELGEAAGLDQAYAYGALAAPYAGEGGAARGGTEDVRALIRQAVRETADEGHVVIVSHAASMALAGRESCLRVLVTASPETRARRLAGGEMDEKAAARAVKDADAGRADYLKRFYGVDRELPTHYDLVVNTDALSEERAAEMIAGAARAGS